LQVFELIAIVGMPRQEMIVGMVQIR